MSPQRDGRTTNKQGTIELLSQWNMDDGDEQKLKEIPSRHVLDVYLFIILMVFYIFFSFKFQKAFSFYSSIYFLLIVSYWKYLRSFFFFVCIFFCISTLILVVCFCFLQHLKVILFCTLSSESSFAFLLVFCSCMILISIACLAIVVTATLAGVASIINHHHQYFTNHPPKDGISYYLTLQNKMRRFTDFTAEMPPSQEDEKKSCQNVYKTFIRVGNQRH